MCLYTFLFSSSAMLSSAFQARAAMQRKGEWFVRSVHKGNPATSLVLNHRVLHACATYLVFTVDPCGAFWICSLSKSAAIWAVNLVLLLLRVRKKETIHHILLPIKRHWNAERSSHLKACLTIQYAPALVATVWLRGRCRFYKIYFGLDLWGWAHRCNFSLSRVSNLFIAPWER